MLGKRTRKKDRKHEWEKKQIIETKTNGQERIKSTCFTNGGRRMRQPKIYGTATENEWVPGHAAVHIVVNLKK